MLANQALQTDEPRATVTINCNMIHAPLAAERQSRSMKGDVKTNISPPTGRRTDNVSWQPAPPPLRRLFPRLHAVFDGSSQRGVVIGN